VNATFTLEGLARTDPSFRKGKYAPADRIREIREFERICKLAESYDPEEGLRDLWSIEQEDGAAGAGSRPLTRWTLPDVSACSRPRCRPRWQPCCPSPSRRGSPAWTRGPHGGVTSGRGIAPPAGVWAGVGRGVPARGRRVVVGRCASVRRVISLLVVMAEVSWEPVLRNNPCFVCGLWPCQYFLRWAAGKRGDL